MNTLRQTIKKAASGLGVEVMTPRGKKNLLQSQHTVTEEYLRLLTKMHGIQLSPDSRRIGLLSSLVGTGTGEGSHLVASLAAVKQLRGDVCECGVGSGATSALLANELRGTGKVLWLYDTFEGLPAPTTEDELIDDIDQLGSMAAYTGRMSHSEFEVRRRMNEIGISGNAFKIVKGLFDASISADRLPDEICFAYVDFDFYAPIKAALEKLSPRLVPGGIIVIDDYGFFSKGAQLAVDEFRSTHSTSFEIEIPDYCADHFAILRKCAV